MSTAAEIENYPGELAMLRGLVSVIRTIAEHGDMDELRRVLAEHEIDEQAAYGALGEKATAPAATATPAEPTGRVGALLAAIRLLDGRWTITSTARFYRNQLRRLLGSQPNSQVRALARADLADLAASGWLTWHSETGRQFYTLKTRKDGRS